LREHRSPKPVQTEEDMHLPPGNGSTGPGQLYGKAHAQAPSLCPGTILPPPWHCPVRGKSPAGLLVKSGRRAWLQLPPVSLPTGMEEQGKIK